MTAGPSAPPIVRPSYRTHPGVLRSPCPFCGEPQAGVVRELGTGTERMHCARCHRGLYYRVVRGPVSVAQAPAELVRRHLRADERWRHDWRGRTDVPPSRCWTCAVCKGEQRVSTEVDGMWCTGYVPRLHEMAAMSLRDLLWPAWDEDPWGDIDGDDEDARRDAYAEYLTSWHWRRIRRCIFERAEYVCEDCESTLPDDVHHLTYVRLGCEEPEDLVALCRSCHDARHWDDW